MKKYNKPIIGIISKPNIFCTDNLFTQQIVYDSVRCAVLKNGGIAIGILPTQIMNKFSEDESKEDKSELSKQELIDLYNSIDICDGIILEGGLSSASYEIEAAKYAIKNDIPLLGICAGFNNIIRAMNGKVFKIENEKIHNQENGKIAHKNIIKKDSILYDILKTEEVDVNSIHEMFASEDDIENLEISALSEDGFVEAVEIRKNKFLMGLKWHPELMIDYDKNMNKIFKYFLKMCENNNQKEL